jgi:hypothetical protein
MALRNFISLRIEQRIRFKSKTEMPKFWLMEPARCRETSTAKCVSRFQIHAPLRFVRSSWA